jgi:hypothetical protein
MAQHRNYSVSPYSAFVHRLHQVIWPDKFHPGPIEKYDGTTNPKEWIQIYEMVIKAASGDDYVKANFLPTVLQGSARTWLMNLPECTVQSWNHLRQLFEANFHATYSRPRSEDDLFTFVQKSDEHLRDFIRRFSEIRNTIPNMTEDRVIIAFKQDGC